MAEQGVVKWAKGVAAGKKADSSKGDQGTPTPEQVEPQEGATESNVAGQGVDQLGDADRERLKEGN